MSKFFPDSLEIWGKKVGMYADFIVLTTIYVNLRPVGILPFKDKTGHICSKSLIIHHKSQS